MNEMREVETNDLANLVGGCRYGCFPPPNYCHPHYEPHYRQCESSWQPRCGGYEGGCYPQYPQY
jgi:hypothetical protein